MTISIACANGITCTNPGCTHNHPINGDPKDLEIAALKASLEMAMTALESIANTDYRGNRSAESQSAWRAMVKIRAERLAAQEAKDSGTRPVK